MADTKRFPLTNAEDTETLLRDYMEINNDLANLQRELVQKNRAIEVSERRFRSLVNLMPDAQIVLSSQGRILYLNPAALKMMDMSQDDILNTISQITTYDAEISININGKSIWVEARKEEVTWDNDDGVLLSIRDVSIQKKAELERMKAKKLEGVLEMAGAASHEFSQPLQSLRMDVQFVKDEIVTDDVDIQDAFKAIVSEIDRLAYLVNKTQRITRYVTTEYSENVHIVDIEKASE